jgi:hypothetical protein
MIINFLQNRTVATHSHLFLRFAPKTISGKNPALFCQNRIRICKNGRICRIPVQSCKYATLLQCKMQLS